MSVRPLIAQRLLLAGLVCTMVLSALLLWMLRSEAERGRAASRAAQSTPDASRAALDDPAARAALAPTAGTDAERARAAVATTAKALDLAQADESVFDPGAIVGRVLSGGAGVPGGEPLALVLVLEQGEVGRDLAR